MEKSLPNNVRYINELQGDKDYINDTNYDNMKLTRISMSSSSSLSSSSTSTTLKSAESDLNEKALEKLSTYYRSTTTTPTLSLIAQESITNSTTSGCDWGHVLAETLTRPSRTYRIIDSDVSQKILQRLVADKVAAVQTSTGKGTRFLKRKGSSKETSTSLFQRQPNFGSQVWNKSEELSLISTTPNFRNHFEVVRTSSFNENQTQIIRKHLDYNRNSLPLNIISLNNELVLL
ncbi:hypothetical protein X798_06106 [Onchocerca flexuosa]|uniref:Uncharacterized protein n=1 Tax=Onchocerca flexuosa TaxID=387005 RepID=A0A238BQF0_9BILA|nr:hypothetical protein X798_06106 [Onchocerca flexuosa]